MITEGISLVHKPSGPTSHDIVDWARKQTGIRRIGHAGTLDPFADGLLILLVGKKYTSRQSKFLHMDKTYEATIHLGATSTTDDCMGDITHDTYCKKPYQEDIQHVLQKLTGTYEQMPPHFSAKKIAGTPAYKIARKGEMPTLKPKRIMVHSIELLSFEWPLIRIRATVSSGTYIRALARDIGAQLGCGAYCEALTRTAIGPYILRDALSPSQEHFYTPTRSRHLHRE